jgi:hypothetical protein
MGFQYREFFGFGARENTARVLVRGMSDTRVLPTRPAANDSSDHHRGSIPARARTARGAAGARKSLCRIQHKVCATRPARLIATMRAALKRVHPRRSSGIYPSRGSPRSGTALLRLSRTECFPLFSPSGFFFLTVHSSGEQQQISDEPVALHKRQLARLSDPELQRSYEMYPRALALDQGEPPAAAHVQYYVECWRELRRRRSAQRRFAEHSIAVVLPASRSVSKG